MGALASKSDNPLLNLACIATACIAVILLCAAAIAAIMDRIPVSEAGAPVPQSANARATLAAQSPAQGLAKAPAQPQAANQKPVAR